MTTQHKPTDTDPYADRFWQDLESAMLAKTVVSAADVPPERRAALLQTWLLGSFNAAALGLPANFDRSALLVWTAENTIRHLTYHAPTGLSCHLGRAYRQPDGSWAALVVAGVGRDEFEAMARAEWAVSRLTA